MYVDSNNLLEDFLKFLSMLLFLQYGEVKKSAGTTCRVENLGIRVFGYDLFHHLMGEPVRGIEFPQVVAGLGIYNSLIQFL